MRTVNNECDALRFPALPPTQVYHSLKSVIKDKYGQDACNVGDEGGFAPNIQSNLEGIELLMAAIKKAGYEDKVWWMDFDWFVLATGSARSVYSISSPWALLS